jgi:hypothetical protein
MAAVKELQRIAQIRQKGCSSVEKDALFDLDAVCEPSSD